MRKSLPLLILAAVCLLFSACGKDRSPETKATENTTQEVTAQEETGQEKPDIANEKPVYLYYMDYDSDTAQSIKTFETELTDESDIGIFAALATDRESFAFGEEYGTEINMHKEIWDEAGTSGDYKIGYEISFDVDGDHRIYTILSPEDVEESEDLFMGDVDTEEVTGYLGVWLYDDYHQDGGFYVHVSADEYDSSTLLTSIKLRFTPQSGDISNLSLTAFSYSNALEFDSDGHYNSVYGSRVSIVW